ncbi:hypothetical protein QFZ27_004670 [Inquilinus ginsengisoli]|uniref:hypothetical protein n=1 Tax=Inquilinus ginsengisoli TaxID=363840 RepID=UPI003D22CE09
MDDINNTSAAAVETYDVALARISKANAVDGRMLSHTQVAELQNIARQQWGAGDVVPAPQARHGSTPTVIHGGTAVRDEISDGSADGNRAGQIAEREAMLAPYGLREHAGRSTADEAVAIAGMFQAEGVEPEQAGALLQHFRSDKPATEVQMRAAFGSLSEEDDDLVVDYLNALADAHPKLNVMASLQRAGLLGNAGFLAQVAEHVRAKRR